MCATEMSNLSPSDVFFQALNIPQFLLDTPAHTLPPQLLWQLAAGCQPPPQHKFLAVPMTAVARAPSVL